uniref:Uncharacterized protein n=1 Tax=Arundo donax TaxID=35708 RepID=A0A0A9AD77_ARUDO
MSGGETKRNIIDYMEI